MASLGISARKGISLTNLVKRFSTKPTTNGEINPQINNRNPRNLEKIRISRKPSGYTVDNINVSYFHKLELVEHSKYISAKIRHYEGNTVVSASTKEWAILKHLFSAKDKQAYIILAKVFAQRCLETGIFNFACFEKPEENSNGKEFLKVLEQEGLMLSEPNHYDPYAVWHKNKEKAPWTVLED